MKIKANTEIRQAMHEKRVPVWAVAEVVGVHENTMLRRLRTELPSNEREHILRIVERIAEENDEKESESDV